MSNDDYLGHFKKIPIDWLIDWLHCSAVTGAGRQAPGRPITTDDRRYRLRTNKWCKQRIILIHIFEV